MSFESWEAQGPSEGFADRATAAVLRDRALASRRPRRRPWLALAAAACVTIAGAAWAWTSRVPYVDASTFASPPIERADPTPARRPRNGREPAPSARPVPPPAATVARPRPPALPVPSAASSASKVPAPLCQCNAFACDCGPE